MQYSDVFQPELGMMKDFKAKIFVDPTIPLRFCKARSVPYAMRSLVEAELDKLVDQGIMTPVKHADWVAPIVPIMKADRKSVRICGDFSQKFVVINISKGLFRYNRLPFGISSAPEIFQRVIENLLQGIPNVVVYLDDILVTGSSEEQHLTNLC